MDFNFTDLKKEAAATADDIFSHTSEAAKQVGQDLLGNLGGGGDGRQDDNSHTEQSFGNEQKEMDFEHVDPQTFVQRMSAGAKEAQEQLDAKFSQTKDDLEDFFGQTSNTVKQGVAAVTNDFMNAERGFVADAGDKAKEIEKKAAQAVDDLFGSHLGGGDNNKFEASAPLVDSVQSANNNLNNFMDDNVPLASFGKTTTTTANANKDSDNDSPSISYNPSPVKKLPATDALKEQDNEKFISSEDLLGDFKDERTATPDSQASAKLSHTTAPAAGGAVTTTDLDLDDDDEGFVQAEVPAKQPEQKISAPVVEPTPVSVPVAKPAPVIPEPAKTQPPSVSETKKETPTPVVADTKPKTTKTTNAQHPNIVSVEDIFYKYGLDAWFKPERLHPRVESLIYWRDVKKSGIVFGAGLVTLLAISCFSVISVFAYLSLILLTGTIAFRIYKSIMQAIQKTSDGHPFKEYLEFDLTLSQEKIQNIAGVAVAHLNGFIAELRRLFLVEDLVDSIKFGVILWVMTYIGAWFNGMTLVILAFVSLFTLPKVYENNKQSIDTYLDLARSKVAEVTEKIKVAIPIGNKKPIAAETDKDK